jgi:hypothetical protein
VDADVQPVGLTPMAQPGMFGASKPARGETLLGRGGVDRGAAGIIVAVCLFACRNDGGRVTGHSTTRTPLNMSMPQAKSTVPAFAGVNSMSTGLFSGSGRLIFNEGTATSVAQV